MPLSIVDLTATRPSESELDVEFGFCQPLRMGSSAGLRVPLQTRSQRTRAALVEAARFEFATKGYALATAKSIADRAAVGTGTFYHYFPDKDAVLREITKERVQWLLDRSEPLSAPPASTGDPGETVADASRRLRALVELYVDYHRADKGLHAVITERRLCDPELDEIMAASEREAVERLRCAIRLWGYDGDAQTAAFMAFSLLEGAVHGHVLTQAILSDARFTQGLVEALLRIAAPLRLFGISPKERES